MPKDTKSRGWTFTVNNYTDQDVIDTMNLYEWDTNCSYLVIGFEVSPRTSTPHLQCYVYYTNALRWSEMSKRLYGLHFEKQKAKSNVNAYVYCKEDGDWLELGNRPKQGYRTDLEDIRLDLLNGTSLKTISDTHFNQWVFHRRSFSEYVDLHKEKYNTQLFMYAVTPKAIKEVCFRATSSSLVMRSQYEKPVPEIYFDYYSGKYDAIYVPKMDHDFGEELDEYIE